jgi:hypothetical protein
MLPQTFWSFIDRETELCNSMLVDLAGIFGHEKGKNSYLKTLATKYLIDADRKDTCRRLRKSKYKIYLKQSVAPLIEQEIREKIVKIVSDKVSDFRKFLE